MEDFNSLVADVKEIKQDVKEISKTLGANTASLIIHEARTDVAEHRLTHLENTHRWFIGLLASTVVAVLIKLLFH